MVINGRDEKNLDQTIHECENKDNVMKNLKIDYYLFINNKKKIIKVAGDITDGETQNLIVKNCIEKFGRINVLVNNAGILQNAGIEHLNIQDFDQLMNINVKSIICLTQKCVPYLIKSKGSVVNVSSVAGSRSFPNVLSYCMSKAALDQFTKCVALELADKGVRVNSVNPGVIVTNIHKRAGHDEEEYKNFLQHCKNTHALGRPGTVQEVADTIAFLASDNASFITGELVHVDGGRHAMTPR